MKPTPSSPLALAVLALLYEEPMHPYRMQHLIKQRGKDEVINVQQRAGLYQTIERLQRAGLISMHEVVRQEGRPDRTLYQLTPAGRETALRWMREMLATPAREYNDFPAALAHLPLLSPDEAQQAFGARAVALTAELARVERNLANTSDLLPRLFLLEVEYQRTTIQAELGWVQALIADLASGALTWNPEWLRAIALRFEHATWTTTPPALPSVMRTQEPGEDYTEEQTGDNHEQHRE